jgi:hypothetical protein
MDSVILSGATGEAKELTFAFKLRCFVAPLLSMTYTTTMLFKCRHNLINRDSIIRKNFVHPVNYASWY